MKKLYFILSFFLLFVCTLVHAQQLVPGKKGSKWGFVNLEGEFVIAPIYTAAGEFEAHYTWVNMGGKAKNPQNPYGGKWGIIDKTGKEVVPVAYDYVDLCNEGLAAVNNGGKTTEETIEGGVWGFVDINTGQEVIPLQYTQVGAFYKDGVAWVQKGGTLKRKVRILNITDEKGKIKESKRLVLVPPMYKINNLFVHFNATGTWALIDKTGKELTGFNYCATGDFHNGMAWVSNNGKYGCVNTEGTEIIPLKYDNITDFFDEGVAWAWEDETSEIHKIGLVDKTGKELTEMKYHEVSDFHEGVAWVAIDEKFGLINKNGKELTEMKYEVVGDFYNGIAWVSVNGLYGFVNREGVEITSIIYPYIQLSFGKNSCIRFNMNNNETILGCVMDSEYRVSWIDHNGNILVPFESGKIEYNIDEVLPDAVWDY